MTNRHSATRLWWWRLLLAALVTLLGALSASASAATLSATTSVVGHTTLGDDRHFAAEATTGSGRPDINYRHPSLDVVGRWAHGTPKLPASAAISSVTTYDYTTTDARVVSAAVGARGGHVLPARASLRVGLGIVAAKGLANEVPAYAGGKTAGTLAGPGGAENALISGWHPPAALMPKGTPGMNIVTKSHVETHAAAIMRNEGLTNATLWINRAPCGGATGCGNLLPRMVPTGSTLTINVVPNGSAGSIAQTLIIRGVG